MMWAGRFGCGWLHYVRHLQLFHLWLLKGASAATMEPRDRSGNNDVRWPAFFLSPYLWSRPVVSCASVLWVGAAWQLQVEWP